MGYLVLGNRKDIENRLNNPQSVLPKIRPKIFIFFLGVFNPQLAKPTIRFNGKNVNNPLLFGRIEGYFSNFAETSNLQFSLFIAVLKSHIGS